MKFTSILKSVILEQSRFELLFDALTKPSKDKEGNKVKPKLSKKEFVDLVVADPTTRTNNVDMENADTKELAKVKAGKYVQWLIKSYLGITPEDIEFGQSGYNEALKNAKDLFFENLYKVTNSLQKFEKFKVRLPEEMRDINKLTPDTLYDAVKDFSLEKTKASKEEKKSAATTYEHPGGDVVFRGEKWTVIKISDKGQIGKDAACFYGGYHLESPKGETNWCTSSPGYNWFERYISKGPLYVVIPTTWEGKRGEKSGLPAERYQFHFPDQQFMDVNDRQQDLIKLLNGPMAELKDFFKPEFAKGLTTGGEKIVIDSFSSGNVGKFIGLYGLDDLFENLPVTLKEFQIQNRDKNDIIITIPETIGKFKDLVSILFDNCIDKLPEVVCTLPKLRFISLTNNPKLTTIPDCVADMESIFFVNLKGSPNVNLSDSLKERGNNMGGGLWDFQNYD
jgi:hypothetical protein